jgi:hypothetical protein
MTDTPIAPAPPVPCDLTGEHLAHWTGSADDLAEIDRFANSGPAR